MSTALGLLAKESAVGILGAMLAYDLAYRVTLRGPRPAATLGRQVWDLFRTGYVALVPPFAAVALLRAAVYRGTRIRPVPFSENPLVGADAWSALLTALKVVGRYVWHLIWPAALSWDYSYNAIPLVRWPPSGWEDWQGWVALAGLLALIVTLVRRRHRDSAFVFFALFFLLTLLPVCNLLFMTGTIMADRLVYLPSVGFAGTVVLGVSALCTRSVDPSPTAHALARGLLVLVVLAYGARTVARNEDWRDELRLYESGVRAAPGSAKVHKALADALAAQDPERQLDRVIAEEERAVAIFGTRPGLLDTDGWGFLQALGEHYETRATLLGASTPEGRDWLARSADMLARAAKTNAAAGERERGAAYDIAAGGAPRIYAALGRVRLALGDEGRAAEAFDRLVRLAPNDPDGHIGVARVHMARGEFAEAAVPIIAALTLDPRRQEAWQLLSAVYERTDPGGCALIREAGRAGINWSCPLVHGQLCAADAQLVQSFVAVRQPQAAAQLAQYAVRAQRCPADAIQSALTGSAGAP